LKDVADPAGRPGRGAFLSRTVLVLGAVSFLQDAGSEMIAPLLPIFLTATLGAGPAAVGVVEGVAEATSSVLKLVSGRLADRGWSAKRLVIGGYSISTAARPLIGLAFGWGWVLLLRFCDRVGKGIRSAPRDALIAASTARPLLGKAFGFHRSLDHAGAVVGPLLAFALLASGMELRHVFVLSVVPGVALLALLAFRLPATPARPGARSARAPLAWRSLNRRTRTLIAASGVLALGTTPEAFLVLWASAGGLDVVWVPLLWSAASAAKAVLSLPGGHWSDRLGRLPVLFLGWGLRAVLLVSVGLTRGGDAGLWGLFLAYAASLALTEGAERALIGDEVAAEERATAFGLYHMVSGLMALPGAVLFGALWQSFGMPAAFFSAAGLTALSLVVLCRNLTRARDSGPPRP